MEKGCTCVSGQQNMFIFKVNLFFLLVFLMYGAIGRSRGGGGGRGDFSPTVSQSLEGDLVLVRQCYPWVYP